MPNPQTLTALLWQNNRTALCLTIALNLLNAGVSLGVLAFINNKLLGDTPITMQTATLFVLLIITLFITSFVSQYGLTLIGHRFVYRLRTTLIKRLLDTDIARLDELGASKLLASLSVDIQTLTMGFVRLPELVQGVVISLACILYLGVLSPVLGVLIVAWLMISVLFSTFLVKKVYAHLENLRTLNDDLYEQYQGVIDGSTALKFNRHRAKSVFDTFTHTAQTYQNDIVKADTFHLSAVNVSAIMVFFGIGVVLIASGLFGVADKGVALNACFVMLFMQPNVLKAVGAYPVLQSAKVSFNKMMSLDLPAFNENFDDTPHQDFESLELQGVFYQYPNGNFALSPVNLTLNKGEIVFLVGDNGSGKTTLAKLLTGLYAPTGGQVRLNGEVMTDKSLYCQCFSAIFSEVYLFDKLLGKNGGVPDDKLIDKWLNLLKLNDKISIDNYTLSTTKLSQGQKKRLALLIALCEEKEVLLLDEWAADQDPEYRKFFYDEILPMLKNMGKTLFVISHDDRFFDKADRLLMMKGGVLKEVKK